MWASPCEMPVFFLGDRYSVVADYLTPQQPSLKKLGAPIEYV